MHTRTTTVVLLAATSLLLLPAVTWAHGGQYQPPPPDPPAGGVPPGWRPPDPDGPTSPGGEPGGPSTGGPTKAPPGAGYGPGSDGPTTGQGPLGGAPTKGWRPTQRGVSLHHWTHWWYANRTHLIDLRARAGEKGRVVTPGGEGRSPDAELWREEAVQALLAALEDKHEDVASGAAVALGKSGDADAAEPLLRVLGNRHRAQPVREGAALGLGLLGSAEDADADRRVRRALEEVVRSEKEPTRLRGVAVYALGLRGGAGAVPFLDEIARSDGATWDVPAAGASALGLSQDASVRELLEEILAGPRVRRDRETMRRVYAAHGLARLGDRGAVPALRAAAVDAEDDVRRAAILALGALASSDDRETAAVLERAVYRDKDRGCRNMACLSLGRLGPDGAERTLRYAYVKGDAFEQPYGALALGILARGSDEVGIPKLLLADFEKRRNADLRGALAIALGLSGYRDAAPALREVVADRGDPQVRGHAALALGLLGDRDQGAPILRKLLDHRGDPALQRETALALGLLGDREAVKQLLAIVEEADGVYLQASAASALGRIGGNESAGALADLLRSKKRAGLARAMGAVGLGLLLDRSEGRGLDRVGADLDWYAQTTAVAEILTIL